MTAAALVILAVIFPAVDAIKERTPKQERRVVAKQLRQARKEVRLMAKEDWVPPAFAKLIKLANREVRTLLRNRTLHNATANDPLAYYFARDSEVAASTLRNRGDGFAVNELGTEIDLSINRDLKHIAVNLKRDKNAPNLDPIVQKLLAASGVMTGSKGMTERLLHGQEVKLATSLIDLVREPYVLTIAEKRWSEKLLGWKRPATQETIPSLLETNASRAATRQVAAVAEWVKQHETPSVKWAFTEVLEKIASHMARPMTTPPVHTIEKEKNAVTVKLGKDELETSLTYAGFRHVTLTLREGGGHAQGGATYTLDFSRALDSGYGNVTLRKQAPGQRTGETLDTTIRAEFSPPNERSGNPAEVKLSVENSEKRPYDGPVLHSDRH